MTSEGHVMKDETVSALDEHLRGVRGGIYDSGGNTGVGK